MIEKGKNRWIEEDRKYHEREKKRMHKTRTTNWNHIENDWKTVVVCSPGNDKK